MIRLMIGRELKSIYRPPAAPPGEPLLEIAGVRTATYPGREVDLAVRRGEILGLAGLIGAGRTELPAPSSASTRSSAAASVSPAIRSPSPRRATPSPGASTSCRRTARRAAWCSTSPSPTNIALPQLPALARGGLVDRRRGGRARRVAERRRLAIRAPTWRRRCCSLSGGNQQKVVLAKWLAMQPRAIIFDEPTRGIDVGAKREIYDMMRALADCGRGDPDDLQRHGGGHRGQRPHRGDARGRDQRHPGRGRSSPSTGCWSWPWDMRGEDEA